MKAAALARRENPMRCAFTPGVLAEAALMIGREFPLPAIAEHLRVNARQLDVELHRIGLYRRAPQLREADADLVLHLRLTQAEWSALGEASRERHMYRDALAGNLLRAVLQGAGLPAALAALDDRRRA